MSMGMTSAPPVAVKDVRSWRLLAMMTGAGAIAGALIVTAYQLTLPRIEHHQGEVEQAAVNEVLASGASDAARAYRAKRGITGDPRVGVVVQRLVRAECSGVMFTVDPTTRARAIMIEAGWGLGETIVQGLVVPERYRLDESGRVLERSAGELDVAIVPLEGGGTAEINRETTDLPALDDGRLASLFALARRCDEVFGRDPGHDIEWAFEAGSSKATLLQRRAVTT